MKAFSFSLRASVMASMLAFSALHAAPAHAAAKDPAGSTGSATTSTEPGGLGDYLVARFSLQSGDVATAATYSLRALSVTSNLEQVRQAYLATLLAGRMNDATALAGKLAGDPLCALFIADQDAKAGHWDAAARRYAALPSHQHSVASLLEPLLIAWSQAGNSEPDLALATLKPLQTGQKRGVYLLNAAMIADLSGRQMEADRLYRQARNAYPSLNLRMAQVLASWFARSGDQKDADAVLQALTAELPQFSMIADGLKASLSTRPVPDARAGLAESYLALAATLRDQNAPDLVLLLLQYANDLRPHFGAAALLKAELEATRGWNDAALASLGQIEPTDPLLPLASLRRAGILAKINRPDEALAVLKQLVAQNPDNPLPYMQMGDVQREAHRYPEAIDAYTKAIQRIPHPGPQDWAIFYARAIAYDGAHDWPNALADLQHALSLAPNQPSVLNYLAYSWTERGENLPQARAMAEKAVQSEPDEGAFVDTLGWVLLHQGQTDPALEMLQKAAEMDPEDPVIGGHLADADVKAGHLLDAIFQYQNALRFNPAAADIPALRAKLKNTQAAFELSTAK